jgi:protein translocase SecG subunit
MGSFSIFIGLIIFVCFLLVLVVMVQNPKGGGLSSSFGGGGQQMGGVQKTSDFLDRSTWLLAGLLLILILLSNISLGTHTRGHTRNHSRSTSRQFSGIVLCHAVSIVDELLQFVIPPTLGMVYERVY